MLDPHNVANRRRFKKFWSVVIDRANLQSVRGWHFLDETERSGCSWVQKREDAKTIVQPNGLDLRALDVALDSEAPLDTSPESAHGVRLVFLGRLHAIKGLELQVDLLAKLVAGGMNASLHLIGPDDGAGAGVLARARELGVSDRLRLHGPVYGSQRLRWLKQASAVLLTSHYEANSNSAAETLAVGGVLVATDTCHLEQARRASAAMIVARDVEALAQAIQSVIDPARSAQLRERARNFAARHLDWAALSTDMLKFYESVKEGMDSCAGSRAS